MGGDRRLAGMRIPRSPLEARGWALAHLALGVAIVVVTIATPA
jgi:hypothetical protein